MREREREREKDVWWIAWTLRPAFICWSLNCRWSGWCQKEVDTAPPFFDFPTWVCFFEFHHGNAHLWFWMTRLEYNWPLAMDKLGGHKGGCIAHRQLTCFLHSSPGFNSQCSQFFSDEKLELLLCSSMALVNGKWTVAWKCWSGPTGSGYCQASSPKITLRSLNVVQLSDWFLDVGKGSFASYIYY